MARYEAGETIYRRGEPGDSMLVVLSGQVRIVSVASDGSEVLLNIIEPGEVAGEIALLDGGPRTADAIAVQETRAFVLPRRGFRPLLRRQGEVAEALMGVLCQRLRQTTTFVEDAVLLDLPSRVLHRLRTLAERYGQWTGRGVRIPHGLTQEELAESIGVSRMSTNRVLSGWRGLGLIEYGRRFVNIPDLEKLRQHVENTRSRDASGSGSG